MPKLMIRLGDDPNDRGIHLMIAVSTSSPAAPRATGATAGTAVPSDLQTAHALPVVREAHGTDLR